MDPLDQLRDIHLPEQIPNYPIAIGWWLLAALVITLGIISFLKIKHHKAKRYAQQKALKKLAKTNLTISETLAIVKWAAMQYFPRHACANLYGKALQKFLLNSLPEKYQHAFKQLLAPSAQSFEQAYQADMQQQVDENLNKLAEFWLRHALPPQQTTLINKSEVK